MAASQWLMVHSRIRLLGGSLLLLSLLTAAGCGKSGANETPSAARDSVTALGRVVPGRAVMAIAAPPGDRLRTLAAKEGDNVEKDAIIATLATYDAREAELAAARAALKETKERLAAETSHAEASIEQAKAALELRQAQLEFDQSELTRFKSLLSGDAATGRRVDEQTFVVKSRELDVTRARAELKMAQTGLDRVRSSVGLRTAEARVKTAQAQLDLSIIRAPISGRVLKVHVYPGEQTGGGPILQLGDTADMQVIAEVQTQDVGRVKVGQRATVSGDGLEPQEGAVVEVGQLIYKNDVLGLDPRAPRDTRVVEVRIRMDRMEAVERLTNLEVDVRIRLQPIPPAP